MPQGLPQKVSQLSLLLTIQETLVNTDSEDSPDLRICVALGNLLPVCVLLVKEEQNDMKKSSLAMSQWRSIFFFTLLCSEYSPNPLKYLVWWYPGGKSRRISGFEVSLIYIKNSRTAKTA